MEEVNTVTSKEEGQPRKPRSDKGQPRARRRSKDLSLAVRLNNAIHDLESVITDIKDMPADLEKVDAFTREFEDLSKRHLPKE